MKDWVQKPAALLLCLVLLMSAGCRAEQKAPLYVNGEAVTEEELALLGDDVTLAVRMKVLQQWAEELGLADPFSYEELMKTLSAENQRRKEEKEQGGIVYGVVEYTPLQYYNITMGEYERSIKDTLLEVTAEDTLRQWYEAHKENYREIGEITAYVTARSGGQVVSEQEVTLSADVYRSLSEQNEMLVAMLENLYPDQEALWTDEYGIEWTAVCTARTPDTYQPFEDVQGAVGEQYAAEYLSAELDRRVADSAVEDLRPADDQT